MAAIGDLVATMRMNTKPFAAGAERAKGIVERIKTSTLRIIKSIGPGFVAAIAVAGVVAFAKVSKAALSFAKDLVNVASAMQEVMNKFDVVFGENRASMKKWSDDFAHMMGRSKRQIAEFLSSAQDLFVPLGFASDAATQMSKQVTQLALDLASFNNMADADVMRDLQAALTGSGEVMKKYGVIVSEAAVKQELMAQGMSKKQAAAASDVAKVQARLNIILRGTTAAQGDVIRSSASYENSMKSLAAAWEDLKGDFGAILLPVATVLLQVLGGLLTIIKQIYLHTLAWVMALAKVVQVLTFFQSATINEFVDNLTNHIDGLTAASGKVSVGMGEAAIAIDRAGESAAETKRIMKELSDSIAAGFKVELNALEAIKNKMMDIASFGKAPYYKEALKLLMGGASIEAVQRFIEVSKRQEAIQNKAKQDAAKQQSDIQNKSKQAAAAAAIRRSLETPLESYKRKLEEIAGLQTVGALDKITARRAEMAALAEYEGKKPKEEKEEKGFLELPRIMERGSAEAWKKTIQAMYGTGKNKPAEQTAKNTERIARATEDLADRETIEAVIP